MPDNPAVAPTRRPRADAERNRARLLLAAKVLMAEQGAAVSLEHIAREADVSIATLYRHFPVRNELIEAVYRQETDSLVDAAAVLAAKRGPVDAVREWLLLFVEFLDTKKGISEVLGTLIGDPEALYQDSSTQLSSAINALVVRAQRSGDIRVDLEPLDLLRAIGGVAGVRPDKDWKRSAIGLVDVLLKGVQP